MQNWIQHGNLINLLYLVGFETYRANNSMLIPFNIPLITHFSIAYFFIYLYLIGSILIIIFALQLSTQAGWVKKYIVSILISSRKESGNIRDVVESIPDIQWKMTQLEFLILSVITSLACSFHGYQRAPIELGI